MMFQRIMVAYDGSSGSRRALQVALDMAPPSVPLKIVSVEEHIPRFAATIDEVLEDKEFEDSYYSQAHSEARHMAEERGTPIEILTLAGHAAQALVQAAQEQEADLLVMGHSGHSSVWGNFLGTTADKVMRHAPCSVLVVR